jgi:predicted heme/steroid binding protein
MTFFASFLGWLIVLVLFLTLLNYPIKLINRMWISKLPQDSSSRQAYTKLMRFLVGNHRFLAMITLVCLVTHAALQIIYRWVSLPGLIAASLVLINVLLGAFGHYIRKKKRSAWFYAHRTIAALMVAAVAIHVALLGLPAVVWPAGPAPASELTSTDTALTSNPSEKTFSLAELAQYDGKNGNQAYVAVNGVVYDVSKLVKWLGGTHMDLHFAGKDLSGEILQSPHGVQMLERAARVGVLAG